MTVLGVTVNESQYKVRKPCAETLFVAVEDSNQFQSTCIRSTRQLTLNVVDSSGESAFIVRKSASSGCFPGFLHVRNYIMPSS